MSEQPQPGPADINATDEALREAVFQALGAASMCWEHVERAGVFQSTLAKEIGDELVRFIESGDRLTSMTERESMTTYRMRDGSQVYGEFAFVTELEFFEQHSVHDPALLIKEVWVLESREDMQFPAPCEHEWKDGECVWCGEER